MLAKQSFQDFVKKGDYDILCFNEVKVSYEKLLQMNFHKHDLWSENYYQYYQISTAKKGYSGVAIFSKMKPINVKFGLGI